MITLCHVDDIEEGASKGFEVAGKYLFAVKKDDQMFLYYNYCPHLGTPLEWLEDQFLDSDGALIQCSTHGALFLIDSGKCILGPCKGKSLKAIPFVLGNGFMMVEEREVSSLGRI
ncbi:MAG: Rieske (2Fe-2S) protein [Pseudomonadales bacterium]|nr:Rieske (2Fe-2S) protein [Pseudomonadales bacterium]MCP5359015.1 Rieske (2Fe-2S) protein [Pseudomonadales bacterium]